MSKINCKLVMLVLASSILVAITHASESGARISAGEQQTVIDYELTALRFDTVAAEGMMFSQTAVIPRFHKGLPAVDQGVPDMPVRVFILGIPEDARVEASFTHGEIEEISGIDIAPVSIKTRDEDLLQMAPARDQTIYGQDRWYPQDLIKVDPPARFRNQTIVRLEVSPLQYNPASKTLRIYRNLQIVVNHAGRNVSSTPRPESGIEEAFYRTILSNYEQARAFRSVRQQKLSKASSPLALGPAYKIDVRSENIYRITGSALAENGVSLASLDPDKIRLFNNGGRELPANLDDPQPQGIIENAIFVSDGGDGRFDSNDYLLFYGRGVNGFEFEPGSGASSHYYHTYDTENTYFLVLGAGDDADGKRMQPVSTLPIGVATDVISDFQDHLFIEEDRNILFESSLSWFGFMFTNTAINSTRRYGINLIDPVSESTARMQFVFYGPSVLGAIGAPHRVTVEFNQQPLVEWPIFGSSRRQRFRLDKSGGLQNGENEILLRYQGSGDAARLYIDYLEVEYARNLRMPDTTLIFNGRLGSDNLAYQIENVNASDLWLFEVSDFSEVRLYSDENWQRGANSVTFVDQASAQLPKRYVAVAGSDFVDVDQMTLDAPSDLRSTDNGADMIIISHRDFMAQAQRIESLRENWHPGTSIRRMSVEVVDIQNVFDEFSSGIYDPEAIRHFLKYAYDNWQQPPAFVILLGDGDHDPKNLENTSDKNWIPTHHTAELDDIDSRVTDTWYTYLAGNDRVMDMAIGRIPARTLTDAEAFVDKLIQYETTTSFGAWRNTAIMVADDETVAGGRAQSIETIHIRDTQELINDHTPKYLDIKKLYLTEFASVQSASISGIRKPTATETLLRWINSGALLVNYAGHGNPSLWAHERLLNISSDFDKIQNGDRLSVWVAATCTFGKFDMTDRQSFAEELLMAPNRGAVGVLATTRDVFASSNARLNQAYYDELFLDNQISEQLGMAMVHARILTGGINSHINDEKFHLYGDPSMRLAIPELSADLTISPDSIKALAVTTVRGQIREQDRPLQNYDGRVRIEVLDSKREVQYVSDRDSRIRVNYDLPGSPLFRGEAQVSNGEFALQFIVPKDLTYGGMDGRINVYFWNDSTDGNGYRDKLAVGGTLTDFTDSEGPEIEIGFVGVDRFNTGGYVGSNPVLEVALTDSVSGINIAGEIGHKITLEIDGWSDEKIDVTDLFNYDRNSFVRGTLNYSFDNITEGRHTVEVKAWDNFNNSNKSSVEFFVAAEDAFEFREVMNYPNPFRNQTSFTFALTQAATRVEVKVYTLAGRLIKRLQEFEAVAGFNAIRWDGRDDDGDQLANGVYLYKITAFQDGLQSDSKQLAEEIGKLVVQR